LTVNGIIIELLKVLKESLDLLREYELVPIEVFKNDRKVQAIVEREFERAIMACIDIGARIISIEQLTPASNYVEIFDRLKERGIVSAELNEAVKDLVRFRNVLSHEYFRIIPDRVHEKLRTSLSHFVSYAKRVDEYLRSSKCKPMAQKRSIPPSS
jgi:uncharacterized protein YutE (UPF0331/DUF86 family)